MPRKTQREGVILVCYFIDALRCWWSSLTVCGQARAERSEFWVSHAVISRMNEDEHGEVQSHLFNTIRQTKSEREPIVVFKLSWNSWFSSLGGHCQSWHNMLGLNHLQQVSHQTWRQNLIQFHLKNHFCPHWYCIKDMSNSSLHVTLKKLYANV